jgi:hypothetical protein
MQEMILASHALMLLRHDGLPVIVALEAFGPDTGRELEVIGKHWGGQGVEAHVCEHFGLLCEAHNAASAVASYYL